MSAALIAYRYPRLSQFALDHVFTEGVTPLPPLPDEPKPGRHAAPKKRAVRKERRWPKWLRLTRRGARKWAEVIAGWWRDAVADDPDLAELPEAVRALALLTPITGRTDVTMPRLLAVIPVAKVAGSPPWSVIAREARA